MAKLPRKPKESQSLPRQMNIFEGRTGEKAGGVFYAFLQRFARYGWDMLGVILLSSTLITLLGFLGITKGVLITPLVSFLTRWLGLGRFILVLSLFVIGATVVRWRKHPPEHIGLGRIVTLELASFILLAILSITDGSSIAEAEGGSSMGGIIGWGIAELFRVILGRVGGVIVLIIAFCVLVSIEFNLFGCLEKWVQARLERFSSSVSNKQVVGFEPSSVLKEEDVEDKRTKAKKEKETTYIPPEFRKSFAPVSVEDEKPDNPPDRAEVLPPLMLLEGEKPYSSDKRTINMTAGLIEKTLADFGIPAKVVGFRVGPTVTQYAVEPGFIEKNNSDEKHKVRISQISSLSRDLTLALKAERLRIEAPVPGKSYVGIEVPNSKTTVVRLRPILESEAFYRVNSPLAVPLGRDVSGQPVVSDLATMPHLLIAGTTGSGKSVCIAALTTCLVMNNTPEELRLVMIDPKLVELMRFNGLPHILGQVETDIERILGVLRWVTTEMDHRYKLLEKVRARNLDSYNVKMSRTNKTKLPRLVVMIDELADLMMTAPDQTEHALVRLAQKSRAVGIHLVVATQRPSTDVVTGVIKANFPTRIAFTMASSIDSRVVLDTNGAETLLGKGDMLFLHPELGIPQRSQGVMVTDKELDKVIKWWKKASQAEPAKIAEEVSPWEETINHEGYENEDDALIDQAIDIVRKERRASASYLQRQLRVGYPRAARLIDKLEEMGVLGPSKGGGKEREILIASDEENQ